MRHLLLRRENVPQGVTYGNSDAFCRPYIFGVAYLFGQNFEILVAGNHLKDLLYGDFAAGNKRRRSN